MLPELEVSNGSKRSTLPGIHRGHPVVARLLAGNITRGREGDEFDASGLDGFVGRRRDSVRRRDFELEQLGVFGGRVELEGGRVSCGKDERLGEGLDGERNAGGGARGDVVLTNGV